ncbi:MAG: DOMON-like domain-containing protein [Chromatiales bacterium]|jgi:hypothetical protein
MTAENAATAWLVCHPFTPVGVPARIRAAAAFRADGLSVSFALLADSTLFRIAGRGPARRRHGLWRTTCFEAFVQGEDRPAYREVNLAPSGDWAAYRFERYRTGGEDLVMPAPAVRCGSPRSGPVLDALLPVGSLPPGDRLDLGLAVVLERVDGHLSYWAVRHPPGAPDFHRPEGLALRLRAPGASAGRRVSGTAIR